MFQIPDYFSRVPDFFNEFQITTEFQISSTITTEFQISSTSSTLQPSSRFLQRVPHYNRVPDFFKELQITSTKSKATLQPLNCQKPFSLHSLSDPMISFLYSSKITVTAALSASVTATVYPNCHLIYSLLYSYQYSHFFSVSCNSGTTLLRRQPLR